MNNKNTWVDDEMTFETTYYFRKENYEVNL
jgi:hypothetical protein